MKKQNIKYFIIGGSVLAAAGITTAIESAIEFTFPKFKTFVLIFTSKAGTLRDTEQTCIALSEIKILGGSITNMTSSTMD